MIAQNSAYYHVKCYSQFRLLLPICTVAILGDCLETSDYSTEVLEKCRFCGASGVLVRHTLIGYYSQTSVI